MTDAAMAEVHLKLDRAHDLAMRTHLETRGMAAAMRVYQRVGEEQVNILQTMVARLDSIEARLMEEPPASGIGETLQELTAAVTANTLAIKALAADVRQGRTP